MALQPGQLAALSGLLDRMLALPAADRAAWVDALGGDDVGLAPALRDLLAQPGLLTEATATPAEAWSSPLQQAIDDAMAAGAAWPAGTLVGPWRLLGRLGEGGMGIVCLAERADGELRREVALKLPRPGLQRWRLGERFERERDILAALDHPHIARLIDAGVAADGQPWLAMELVRGVPITVHSDQAALGLRARLRLFLQVLGAVHHAHQRLVVHRDLKPSNILVDESGRVRLLDFGIALLQDERRPQAALTELGHPLLTPRYAAPEQIAGEPVSTAADIYALGVVLCELLSGHSPYAAARDSRAAIEEAVLRGELQRPSALAAPALRAALRGDLDNIVAQATLRDPAHRYASADAFARDLERHLDGLPVHAAPASLVYRARKFAARHRLAVGAGAAVTVALLAGSAVALWQAGVAREQAAQAQREARRAGAVQSFLIGLFNEADPARAQGRELTARDLMARAERDLRSRLADEPEASAALRSAMVELYLKLGDEKSALPIAQAQLEQAERQSGPTSADTGLAVLALGRVQASMGRYDEALPALQRAGTVLAALGPAQADKALSAQVQQAEALIALQRSGDARTLLLAALPRLAALHGANAWPVIAARSQLAVTYSQEGLAAEAAAQYLGIEPLLDAVGPEHALDAAELRGDLGYGAWLVGRWADARRALERSRADFDRLEGPHNSNTIRVQRTLLSVLSDMGDYTAAAVLADDNARRSAAFYGADDGEAALDESFRVIPLVMTGQTAAALAAARLSVRVAEAHRSLTEIERRGLQRRLGLALLFDGRSVEALPLLQALADADRTQGVTDGRAAATLLYLSAALRLQGDASAAADRAGSAAATWHRRDALASRSMAARAELAQALALAAGHETAAAQVRLDAGTAALRADLPPAHPLLLAADVVRAAVLAAGGQREAAATLDREARAALRDRAGISLPADLPLLP